MFVAVLSPLYHTFCLSRNWDDDNRLLKGERIRTFPDAFQTLSRRPTGILDVTVGADPTVRRKKDAPVSDKCERYISYLLRLWQATDGDQVVWQASLENAQTGERRGFADLDALLNFLRQTTDTETPHSAPDKE